MRSCTDAWCCAIPRRAAIAISRSRCSTPSPNSASTPASAGRAGTRKSPAPRSGFSPSAIRSASGTRKTRDSIAHGRVVLRDPSESRNRHQSVTLLDAIAEFGFDACIGGARRDEEKSRAKERIFSFRDSFGQWDPKNQRPELWSLFNARVSPGEHVRVFPISNWTELDVWQYIARERLAVPAIYLAHSRPVVRRGGALVSVTPLTPPRNGEMVEHISVRFRTVGDISCTAPVASLAASVEAIIAETAMTTITERGATRLDDQT
ncbi:MAG: sulfate adenylyltransferase subunit CysD, partial [Betaproteobacteria bacterium]